MKNATCFLKEILVNFIAKKFSYLHIGLVQVVINCYPDLTLVLDDSNIVKALTLNIASSGYRMEEGSKPFALIYRIYYILLGTQLNPGARINREPVGKTILIQCSTPDARVQVLKMIQWQDVKLLTEWMLEQETPLAKPTFDELDLTHIQQYLDGTIKISFKTINPRGSTKKDIPLLDLKVFQKEIKISMNFFKRVLKNPLT